MDLHWLFLHWSSMGSVEVTVMHHHQLTQERGGQWKSPRQSKKKRGKKSQRTCGQEVCVEHTDCGQYVGHEVWQCWSRLLNGRLGGYKRPRLVSAVLRLCEPGISPKPANSVQVLCSVLHHRQTCKHTQWTDSGVFVMNIDNTAATKRGHILDLAKYCTIGKEKKKKNQGKLDKLR